jgi:NarL family two-component system response regulator LiaR
VPLRILVVDDHEVVRMGVRKLIETRTDWLVCGEAADGEEAVERVRQLAPDVIVLDILMPLVNGFEAASAIRQIAPKAKIILLSIHEVPVSAREVGADAFVSKASVAMELLETIERLTKLTQTRANHV